MTTIKNNDDLLSAMLIIWPQTKDKPIHFGTYQRWDISNIADLYRAKDTEEDGINLLQTIAWNIITDVEDQCQCLTKGETELFSKEKYESYPYHKILTQISEYLESLPNE